MVVSECVHIAMACCICLGPDRSVHTSSRGCVTSIRATVGWFCCLRFVRASVSQFETEKYVSFTSIPVPFPSVSFITLHALIWPKRRRHNITLDVSLKLAYSLDGSGKIASRTYRLWTALNGKCPPFALSAGNADIVVFTLFASTADEDSRL